MPPRATPPHLGVCATATANDDETNADSMDVTGLDWSKPDLMYTDAAGLWHRARSAQEAKELNVMVSDPTAIGLAVEQCSSHVPEGAPKIQDGSDDSDDDTEESALRERAIEQARIHAYAPVESGAAGADGANEQANEQADGTDGADGATDLADAGPGTLAGPRGDLAGAASYAAAARSDSSPSSKGATGTDGKASGVSGVTPAGADWGVVIAGGTTARPVGPADPRSVFARPANTERPATLSELGSGSGRAGAACPPVASRRDLLYGPPPTRQGIFRGVSLS